MINRYFSSTLAIACLLSSSVMAINLGDSKVLNALGEPISIEIEVIRWEGVPSRDIDISIGSQKDFNRLGLVYDKNYKKLKLHIQEPTADGKLNVLITSQTNYINPHLDLVLKLKYTGLNISKRYSVDFITAPLPEPLFLSETDNLIATAPVPSPVEPRETNLLDDQRITTPRPSIEATADLTTLPISNYTTTMSSLPIAITEPIPDLRAQPASEDAISSTSLPPNITEPPPSSRTPSALEDIVSISSLPIAVTEPIPDSWSQPAPEDSITISSLPIAVTEPIPAAEPQSIPKDTVSISSLPIATSEPIPDLRSQPVFVESRIYIPEPKTDMETIANPRPHYQTQSGDTLLSIALEFLPTEANNPYQMLLSLYKLNSTAFSDNNITLLKLNEELLIPNRQELDAVAPYDAKVIFEGHWNEGINRFFEAY